VNLASQGVAMDTQPLCSPHLIYILISQDRGQERPLKFAYRLGIWNTVSVHLQNDSFELLFHGGISLRNQTSGEKNKGCDIGYALAACSREGANNVDARTVTAF
jgi:hypothetical protein